jgi:hypothetical protein
MNCAAIYISVCVSLHIFRPETTRVTAQALIFLISAWEVCASNLDRDTHYPE